MVVCKPLNEKSANILHALLGSGARITSQRRLIAQVIDESGSHPDADDIYRRARRKDPRLSLSTVYRTLSLLKSKGLIQDHRFDEEHAHFEPVTNGVHHHIICLICGRVTEFEISLSPTQRTRVGEQTGYEVRSESIEITGLCPDCRGKSAR